ncbi:MAG: DUF2267 domain-containing protein [Alphaproteobacteria bacterium]|nr:DUF2267 domain-containing protein [Alphaproteobacteria bacterium]
MTRGVLQAFRRRLPLADSLRFARTLPVGLRALYVADWDPDEPLSPVGTRDGWTREAQGLRAEHNFAPPSAVADVAAAVRRHLVDPAAFEAVLAELPPWTREFWSAEPEISSPSGRTRTPAPGR